MKIFSATQIKNWDNITAQEQDITSTELMERAGARCFQWIHKRYKTNRAVLIFCGKGGNGGDGLVIARLLYQAHYQVTVITLTATDAFSADMQVQWLAMHAIQKQLSEVGVQPEPIQIQRVNSVFSPGEKYHPIRVVPLKAFKPWEAGSDDLFIDALFGTGLNTLIKAPVAPLVAKLNALPNIKISIDLPSGLMADQLPGKEAVIFKANYTLCFQAYKRSLLHPEGAGYAGQVTLLDIGLSEQYKKSTPSVYKTVSDRIIQKLYQQRDPYGHKGSFGTAVLVGGSYGKIGAIGLSAHAALRAGAGKVFIQAPTCGYEILQQYLPEAMFSPAGQSYIEEITAVDKAVFGIGPGFDRQAQSYDALLKFFTGHSRPVVLDADALNLLADHQGQLFPLLPKDSILTPHPKEFQRLFGAAGDSMEQVELALEQARRHQAVIILKGHHTATCLPNGKCYYNLTGNAGMGTAGSGDVLTGILTGLLAQGYSSKHAAIFGVYLHGLAGDLAARESSQEALIAGDIVTHLGKAFKLLTRKKQKR